MYKRVSLLKWRRTKTVKTLMFLARVGLNLYSGITNYTNLAFVEPVYTLVTHITFGLELGVVIMYLAIAAYSLFLCGWLGVKLRHLAHKKVDDISHKPWQPEYFIGRRQVRRAKGEGERQWARIVVHVLIAERAQCECELACVLCPVLPGILAALLSHCVLCAGLACTGTVQARKCVQSSESLEEAASFSILKFLPSVQALLETYRDRRRLSHVFRTSIREGQTKVPVK